MTNRRIERLAAALDAHRIDGLAVVPGANLFYFAGLGFTTKLRLTLALFPRHGAPALVLPRMELGRAERASAPFALFPWDDGEGPAAALDAAMAAAGLRGRQIGIEDNAMRIFELRALELAGGHTQDATALVAELRSSKDAAELGAMRRAIVVVEDALRATIAQTRAGMTERQVASLWEGYIRAAGSEPAFDTAVAAGPNGASPHHEKSDRPLQTGDLVVMDGGAYVDGYASDITRTIAVGPIDDELRRIYELTLAANGAGRAAAQRRGASGAQIDAAARAVIAAGGYGPQFLHRTGHGLGIEIHEPPFIVAGSDDPLAVGSVFTIEPGIYLAGRGGVRIEDDMMLTADGAETLTSFPRELITIDD